MQRITRTVASLVLCASAAATGALAQPHPEGINAGGGYPVNGTNFGAGVYTLDKQQAVHTTVWNLTVPGAATYLPNYWRDARMNIDNRTHVYVTGENSSPSFTQTSGVFAFDPQSKATVPIAQDPSALYIGNGIELTTDGDYLVAAQRPTNDTHLLRVTPTGTVQTVLTTVQLGMSAAFRYPIRRDVATGDIVVPSGANPVLAVANDGSVRTFCVGGNGIQPTFGFEQYIRSGAYYYSTQSFVLRFQQGGTGPQTAANLTQIVGGLSATGGVFENQTINNPQMIMHVHSQSASIGSKTWLCWFDRTQNWTVTKTIQHFTSATFAKVLAYPYCDLFHEQNNYVQPIQTGRLQWAIRLQSRAFAGRRYILLPTVSGHVPGFPLDSRRVFLNWDAVTNVAVRNLIPSVFSQGAGSLGATGGATATLDLSKVGLPNGVKFVIHLTLAVIDPNAPSGIAFITEPFPLRVAS